MLVEVIHDVVRLDHDLAALRVDQDRDLLLAGDGEDPVAPGSQASGPQRIPFKASRAVAIVFSICSSVWASETNSASYCEGAR